jgi:AraC-like DNA-binding protein
MRRCFEVDQLSTIDKTRRWTEVACAVYFPISATPADPARFAGKLTTWDIGELSLSRLATEPIQYVRQKHHVKADKEQQILVTFSGSSELTYAQAGTSLICGQDRFFIEMPNRPYEFSQTKKDEIWGLRIPAPSLRWYVRSIERFTPYTFDKSAGIGALLFDMLRMVPRRLSESSGAIHHSLGQNIVELLALALEDSPQVLGSQTTSIKEAHLARIERFVRQNLSNRGLTPDLIASECMISTSYLHQLFRSRERAVGQWIRELRLMACDRDLRDPHCREGIAEIAYRWGFNDHAQFCRHFKSFFGRTPSESRDSNSLRISIVNSRHEQSRR